MMLEDEDEGPQVSFEPFQVSDQCVKLYADGWFHDEPCEDAGLTRLNKEVIVVDKVSKDVTEVDNDRWLVPVKILDHQGPLSCGFPVENRLHPVQTVEDLGTRCASRRNRYSARLADFHLLLFLAKHLDAAGHAAVASQVSPRGELQEGHKIIIDSIAGMWRRRAEGAQTTNANSRCITCYCETFRAFARSLASARYCLLSIALASASCAVSSDDAYFAEQIFFSSAARRLDLLLHPEAARARRTVLRPPRPPPAFACPSPRPAAPPPLPTRESSPRASPPPPPPRRRATPHPPRPETRNNPRRCADSSAAACDAPSAPRVSRRAPSPPGVVWRRRSTGTRRLCGRRRRSRAVALRHPPVLVPLCAA